MTRKFATFLCGGLLGAALFVPASITAQDKPAKAKAEEGCGPGGCCGDEAKAPAPAATPAADGCCGDEAKAKTPAAMPAGDACCGDEKKAVGDGGMAKAGSADEQAMMAAWEAAAKPGEHHRKLDALIGTWATKSTFYCDPKGPQETTGVAVNTWTLGGRFVEQRFFGAMPGTNLPFEGIGMTGFDNVTGKFIGSWIDTMSTGLMTLQGGVEGRTLTLRGEFAAPGGAVMKFRMVHEFTSQDRHLCTMFMAMGDQPETKSMEIVYTRK